MLKEFEEWKRNWYKTVPRCTQFVCCHELTACGVNYLCGDCTIFPTWEYYQQTRTNKVTCTDVSCEDCLKNHNCERTYHD
jgi:hypothetical protein